jgi:hypothetical protein
VRTLPVTGREHMVERDTSHDAAQSASGFTATQRAIVESVLATAWPQGLTDDEGGELLGWDRLKWGRRRNELCMQSKVVDSGERRPTPGGRSAIVWRLNGAPGSTDGEE